MRKSRLSRYKQNKLIELFVAGVTARTAAKSAGVNKNTAAYYFHSLRLLIYLGQPHKNCYIILKKSTILIFPKTKSSTNRVA